MIESFSFELFAKELCTWEVSEVTYFSVEFCIVELSSIIEFSSVE